MLELTRIVLYNDVTYVHLCHDNYPRLPENKIVCSEPLLHLKLSKVDQYLIEKDNLRLKSMVAGQREYRN